jgi:hypothetical protein
VADVVLEALLPIWCQSASESALDDRDRLGLLVAQVLAELGARPRRRTASAARASSSACSRSRAKPDAHAVSIGSMPSCSAPSPPAPRPPRRGDASKRARDPGPHRCGAGAAPRRTAPTVGQRAPARRSVAGVTAAAAESTARSAGTRVHHVHHRHVDRPGGPPSDRAAEPGRPRHLVGRCVASKSSRVLSSCRVAGEATRSTTPLQRGWSRLTPPAIGPGTGASRLKCPKRWRDGSAQTTSAKEQIP